MKGGILACQRSLSITQSYRIARLFDENEPIYTS